MPLKKVMDGTKFLGYETHRGRGQDRGPDRPGQALATTVDEIGHAQPISVVLDRTPFYGESGGQVGDTGELVGKDFRFEVIDTQKEGGFLLHHGASALGRAFAKAATVTARVNAGPAAGHSPRALGHAHSALRPAKAPGRACQAARLEGRRRFAAVRLHEPAFAQRASELAKIEDEVNDRVAAAETIRLARRCRLPKPARPGAMMLFGEKYPDLVRMVSMGEFSKELCGGTHLDNTGQVGLFKIVAEESVAAGTRRITALTGQAALERVRKYESLLGETAAALKAPPDDVPQRVAGLVKEVRELKRQVASRPAHRRRSRSTSC